MRCDSPSGANCQPNQDARSVHLATIWKRHVQRLPEQIIDPDSKLRRPVDEVGGVQPLDLQPAQQGCQLYRDALNVNFFAHLVAGLKGFVGISKPPADREARATK